jgi:hemerythrin-like domain-containing protein
MAERQGTDPIKLLKDDHVKVKTLFDEFEQTSNKRSQGRIAREAILELDVHAGIEEEIFYPAFRSAAAEQELTDIVLEAEEEHHVVHLLISELREMSESDEHFEPKFIVLAENVRHHIEEEEQELLPQAKDVLGDDRLMELGQEMMQRKKELTKQFKDMNGSARDGGKPAAAAGAARAKGN